jgi:protein subunit release factor A
MGIEAKELRIECTKSSGPGGQHKNKRFTAVRITHLPTGLVAVAKGERSQAQNKKVALEQLRAKWREKFKERKKRLATRRSYAARERILKEKKRRSLIKGARREKFKADE